MTLRLAGSTSGYTEIDAPAVAGSNTLVLPTGNGSSGQVLSTNGSGVLSWVDRFSAAGPAFRAYRSTNQTVSNNAWNKLAATAENFDTNSNYDNATNYRFTPTVAGYYQVSGAISIEPSSSPRTRCLAAIYKNGSIYSRGSDVSASDNNASVITDVVYLNGSTDYVELFGYISAAASTYVFAGGPSGEYCYFSAFLARPA
jgi:hypothetical protein